MARNVLELLITHIIEGEFELTGSILLDTRRDADATGISQCFKSGGDIDPVAENIAVLDNDIAHVDADSELDPLRESDAGIPDGHPLLHLYGAAQRVYDAAKLDEQPVAGSFDKPTTMFGDYGVDDLGADRP